MFWCAAPDASAADPRKVRHLFRFFRVSFVGFSWVLFSSSPVLWTGLGQARTGLLLVQQWLRHFVRRVRRPDGPGAILSFCSLLRHVGHVYGTLCVCQVVHPSFIHTGSGEIPSWDGEGIVPNPKQKSAVSPGSRPGDKNSTRLSICKNPKRNATICDATLRTMNIDAECGSPEDVTYYAPWRYLGAAPVIDSCGVAGGVYQWQGVGAAGGDYQPTVHAQRGDMGSDLPKTSSQVGYRPISGLLLPYFWPMSDLPGRPLRRPGRRDLLSNRVDPQGMARRRISVSSLPGRERPERRLLPGPPARIR